jgi:hypothetical protein
LYLWGFRDGIHFCKKLMLEEKNGKVSERGRRKGEAKD